MQNIYAISVKALNRAINATTESKLLKEYADYVTERLALKDDDIDLPSVLDFIAEGWEDQASIATYYDIPGWYDEDPTRYRYADEALQDMDRARVLEAMRVGYCYYLREQVTGIYNLALVASTQGE